MGGLSAGQLTVRPHGPSIWTLSSIGASRRRSQPDGHRSSGARPPAGRADHGAGRTWMRNANGLRESTYVQRFIGRKIPSGAAARQAAQQTSRGLAVLFPQPPQHARSLPASGYLIAVAAGALILLLRQAGRPPWTTIWGEDG